MRHLYRVVRLWSGCDHDVCPGPKATRLREYRVSEKMSQRIEFRHLKILTHLLIKAPMSLLCDMHPMSRLLAFFRCSLSQYLSQIAFDTRWSSLVLRVSDDESKTGARDLPRFRGPWFRWLWILTEPQNGLLQLSIRRTLIFRVDLLRTSDFIGSEHRCESTTRNIGK
jgi:hypothetical protein